MISINLKNMEIFTSFLLKTPEARNYIRNKGEKL
jgi:hypothetical protein